MALTVKRDTTANDSDKSFVVPANEMWDIQWVHVSYASTATAGNRQLRLVVKDDAASPNTILVIPAGAVQAANTTRLYTFGNGLARETSAVDSAILVGIPKLILPAGYTLQLVDSAAVDAAADDMTVNIMYRTGPVQ